MTLEEIVERTKENGVLMDKRMIKRYGADTAVVYAELKRRAAELGGKEFKCQIDDLRYECSVSASKQREILKLLSDDGYISVSLKGSPRSRYIEVLK